MTTLTCVYCGHEYPEGTPPHGHQELTDHIKVCEKHPMSKLQKENAELRKAFLLLSGCKDFDDLEIMLPFLKASEKAVGGQIVIETNKAIEMVLKAVKDR